MVKCLVHLQGNQCSINLIISFKSTVMMVGVYTLAKATLELKP